jgi:lipid-A-disaccharide synthase
VISVPADKTSKPLKVMIVAGEASGDKHGASLARALYAMTPGAGIELFGSGGDEMRAAGVETLVDAREVGIMGVPEIAAALGRLYRAYRTLVRAARSRKPDAVVLIDWPDFNLRLARRLKRSGLKIIYYISPQVWAWRTYRVNAIRRLVDRMLVILPFERDFYKDRGIDAQYVGHPLARTVKVTASRQEFAAKHGLDFNMPFIALLPGSRAKEIHYHVPPMAQAARILLESDFNWPQLMSHGDFATAASSVSERNATASIEIASNNKAQFILPLASTVSREQVRKMLGDNGPAIEIIERDTYNALGHSSFAVVASGTATIETAMTGTPMIIIYKGSELNWRLIRPLIHLDTFGMVNLIAGTKIAPELIQHDVTGLKIAQEVLALIKDPERMAKMREDLTEVRRRLDCGEIPGHEQAARAVLREVGADV